MIPHIFLISTIPKGLNTNSPRCNLGIRLRIFPNPEWVECAIFNPFWVGNCSIHDVTVLHTVLCILNPFRILRCGVSIDLENANQFLQFKKFGTLPKILRNPVTGYSIHLSLSCLVNGSLSEITVTMILKSAFLTRLLLVFKNKVGN